MKNKETALGRALILHFLLSIAVSLILTALPQSGTMRQIYTLIFTAVRYLIPIAYYRSASSYTPFLSPIGEGKTVKKQHSVLRSAATLIFSVTVTVIALNTVGALGDVFLSLFGESSSAAAVITKNSAVFVFIKSVIFASFFEEMLFRGAVLHALQDRKASVRVVISATMFALMHGNVQQFFYAFTAGAVISLFAVAHSSLALATVMHLGANLTTFILSLLKGTLSESLFNKVSILTLALRILLAVLSAVPYFLTRDKAKTDKDGEKNDALPKEIWVYVFITLILTAFGAFTG